LGPSKSMAFGKLGSTAAQISAFPTFEKLLLTVPPGVGGSLDVILIIDGEMGISSKGFKFSYSVPHQTQGGGLFLWPPKGRGGFAVANRPATASLVVTIAGIGFGTQAYTDKTRDGHSAAEASQWISDSIVVGKISSGIRSTRYLSVTVARQWNTRTALLSYDIPSLSALRNTNRAATGSSSITVVGASYGISDYTIQGRLLHTAVERSAWAAETEVFCMISHGLRGTRRIIMTVGEKAGSKSQAWSFDTEKLSLVRRSNRAGTGSGSITIHGAMLGLASYTVESRKGHTQMESTEWESETSVRCLVGHSTSGSRRILMTAGERTCTETQGWSSDLTASSSVRRGNIAGTGSTAMTVHGSSMGLVPYTGRVRNGQTSCESTEWESETSMKCLLEQGFRGTRRVAMTAGIHSGTVTQLFSLDAPMLSIMFPTNNPTTGKLLCTLQGSFMGHLGDSQAGRIGGSSCEQTLWQADTVLLCKVPAGMRGTRKIIATTGQQDGTRTEIFSYDKEGVSSMGPLNAAGTGAQIVTISGNRFGMKDYTDKVRLGFTSCEYSRWISDSTVLSLSAAGIQSTRRVMITVLYFKSFSFVNAYSNTDSKIKFAGWRANLQTFCNRSLFVQRSRNQRHAPHESCQHRGHLSHSTRLEHGARDLHRPSSGGVHGMRVDRMGVGDFG